MTSRLSGLKPTGRHKKESDSLALQYTLFLSERGLTTRACHGMESAPPIAES